MIATFCISLARKSGSALSYGSSRFLWASMLVKPQARGCARHDGVVRRALIGRGPTSVVNDITSGRNCNPRVHMPAHEPLSVVGMGTASALACALALALALAVLLLLCSGRRVPLAIDFGCDVRDS
jgi:hypothetical protein